MRTVWLALGSNLGNRLGHLRAGLAGLSGELVVEAASPVYETPAEGGVDQPPYLNAVVRARSELDPRALLELAGRVEEAAGRVRTERGAARTLDVDLIFVGSLILDEEGLTLPHPRWTERSFVVRPLLDLDPGLRDPLSARTVREVWEEDRPGPGPVRRAAPPEALLEPSPRGGEEPPPPDR